MILEDEAFVKSEGSSRARLGLSGPSKCPTCYIRGFMHTSVLTPGEYWTLGMSVDAGGMVRHLVAAACHLTRTAEHSVPLLGASAPCSVPVSHLQALRI